MSYDASSLLGLSTLAISTPTREGNHTEVSIENPRLITRPAGETLSVTLGGSDHD